jgi:hypothetical protein
MKFNDKFINKDVNFKFMKKVIYDEKGGMNIKILKVFNDDKDIERVFQDKIASNSVFYNSRDEYTLYLEIYSKENEVWIRITLFAKEKAINKISKDILSKIPQ